MTHEVYLPQGTAMIATKRKGKLPIEVCTDADCAGSIVDRRSTSGALHVFGRKFGDKG
jgi:hypothetical protein